MNKYAHIFFQKATTQQHEHMIKFCIHTSNNICKDLDKFFYMMLDEHVVWMCVSTCVFVCTCVYLCMFVCMHVCHLEA